jgi:lipopolysaccharide transport system ATP-binding protein
MAKAIKVENLSKAYQLGDFGTGTISRDLERFWARMRGKEDPFLKIGEVNDRTTKGGSDIVWSLKDLSFEIEQGDAIGIIGHNGAGKSTLLKILSRVTSPTKGSIKIKGRIASLLEVGTGFHPELTGKENIYLNGAILGMRKAEIKRKFDEIVDFSGVERYIDTPVKRYSSGMYVRLAFAVAAHLESEILIVDEVLAVGDSEFQKKCIGKMGEVTKGEGRTVLFVSHNLVSMELLCNKGLVLNNGSIQFKGNISSSINSYLSREHYQSKFACVGENVIRSAELFISEKTDSYVSDIKIVLRFEHTRSIKDVVLGIVIKDSLDMPVIAINNRHYKKYQSILKNVSLGSVVLELPNLPLLPGMYKIDVFLGDQMTDIDIISNALVFNIIERKNMGTTLVIDRTLNKFYIANAKWIVKDE